MEFPTKNHITSKYWWWEELLIVMMISDNNNATQRTRKQGQLTRDLSSRMITDSISCCFPLSTSGSIGSSHDLWLDRQIVVFASPNAFFALSLSAAHSKADSYFPTPIYIYLLTISHDTYIILCIVYPFMLQKMSLLKSKKVFQRSCLSNRKELSRQFVPVLSNGENMNSNRVSI